MPARCAPDAHLRHPEGKWFGLSKRLRGIVYAKDRVDPSEITAYEAKRPAWLPRALPAG